MAKVLMSFMILKADILDNSMKETWSKENGNYPINKLMKANLNTINPMDQVLGVLLMEIQ